MKAATQKLNPLENEEMMSATSDETNSKFNVTIKIGALWISRTKKNDLCLKGNVGSKLNLFLFKNKRKETPEQPDFTVNVSNPSNKQGELINIGAAWSTRDGKELFFKGLFCSARMIVRKNKEKYDERQPDYFVYLGELEEIHQVTESVEEFEKEFA